MHASRKRTWSIDDGGKYYKATVVSPERVEVDTDGLLDALDDTRRREITKVVLDRKALEAALDRGQIAQEEVAPYLSMKPASPYIRYTEGVLEDADEAEDAGDGS